MKKQIFQSIRIIFLVLFLLFKTVLVNAQNDPLLNLNTYIEKSMRDWNVPGLAIAIVKDDSVILAKGFGVRKLGTEMWVDKYTLFAIGSASKSFTSASLAILIKEGKISWEDPVTKHIPSFQLYDPYVTREITISDLLCHRSGLSGGGYLWYGSNYDRNEIIQRIRYLEPSWSFRARFEYHNIMYLVAGQIIPAVTNMSWDEFVKERIFLPLEMNSSNTSITQFRNEENVATPHAKIDEKVQSIPWRNVDNLAPAGAINTNVIDMAKWIRLQLSKGNFNGKQIIDSLQIEEMHTPQTIIPNEFPWNLIFKEAHFLTYGFGWFLHDYKGYKVVQHGGNIDGMSANVAMVPEIKLGIVILTNLDDFNLLPEALTKKVIDAYIGDTESDWSSVLLGRFTDLMKKQDAFQKSIEESHIPGTRPSLSLEKYAGEYTDDMYGKAVVSHQSNKLVLQYGPSFVGELQHWHYDTFRAVWRDKILGKSFVTFYLDINGKVVKMEVEKLSEFKKVTKSSDEESK